VRWVGDARDTAAVTSRGARQAHLEGFDLHANVRVAANDRAGLERLRRYILRPPFAQERLRLRSDGRIALELKTMHRAFAIDVLACPHCGGRLRLIATLHDPVVIRKILGHLGPSPGPASPASGAAAP
jgi:hypothetical protein